MTLGSEIITTFEAGLPAAASGTTIEVSSAMLAALNLAAIGLLPLLFFRRDGRLNLRWWLTASPFFAAGLMLALVLIGAFDGGAGAPLAGARAGAATVLHVVSVALIAFTVGVHRIPLALWHQDHDAPQEIVTWGPYRMVRHPFYVAFVLCLAGLVATLPHPATAALAAYATAALDLTARREERRLLASHLGNHYRRYMGATGRLLPLVGRAP